MADLDHFKQVNDTYGYLSGDAVLKEVSGGSRRACARIDAGRYGGEGYPQLLFLLRMS